MADEADPQAVETQAPVEETTADSAPEIQTQDSDASSTEQAGESKAEEAAVSTDEEKPSDPEAKESKPLSRRSAAYRIQQLTRENKELREQQKPKEQDDWDDPQPDEKPDIQKLI